MMSKISDEIREWCKWCDERSAARDSLCKLADRIDAETVELPRDRDGVSIRVGDTAYTEDGDGFEIVRIIIDQGMTKIVCSTGGDVDIMRLPSSVFHTRPDSFERIADELLAWCDYADVDGDACDKPRELAVRIRKMAEKEGER